MRLCWADKIPLALFVVATVILLALGMTSDPGRPEWFAAFFAIEATIFLKVALPVWIVLRLIDFLTGGPARRAAKWRSTVRWTAL